MEGSPLWFLPCCKAKSPGAILPARAQVPARPLGATDLPRTWQQLHHARTGVAAGIDCTTPRTPALALYSGGPYNAHPRLVPALTDAVAGSQLRLAIISAGYGLVAATEPLHAYEARLEGPVARHWREAGLTTIIGDYIATAQPTHVQGYFAGTPSWTGAGAKYRAAFTAGVTAARELGWHGSAICVYRAEGRGVRAILGALGRCALAFLDADDPAPLLHMLTTTGWRDGNVLLRAQTLSG